MKSGLLSERIIYARIQSHKKENKPVITFETRTRLAAARGDLTDTARS
jgi:hypothetical protein